MTQAATQEVSEAPTSIEIKRVRLNYVSVFEKSKGINGSPGKYEVTMILDKKTDAEQIRKITAAIKQAAVDKFGSKLPAGLKADVLKDGDKTDKPFMQGKVALRASSSMPVGVVYGNLTPIPPEVAKDPLNGFYSGVWANVKVLFAGYDNVSKGVTCYLQNLQKVKNDTPFQGRRRPEDDFDAIEEEPSEAAANANTTAPAAEDNFNPFA